MPWTPKDSYRHTHKAKSPKAQRQWADVSNSARSRGASEGSAIRQANAVVGRRSGHAAGGYISPLAAVTGNPMQVARATAPKLANPLGGAGRMRMPRVPIADTMRNIDQSMHGARVKLPKLRAAIGGRAKKFDEGGKVGLGIKAISVLKNALSHLANNDASSASATLRASPEAMAHPGVQQASQALRSSAGIAPATKTLTGLVNQDTDRQMAAAPRARGGRVQAGN